MSTLTSASTNDEVWAAYDDNASYEEDGDRAKALAFVTACHILIRRRATRSVGAARTELEFDAQGLREELLAARRWLALNPASSTRSTRFATFESFRD